MTEDSFSFSEFKRDKQAEADFLQIGLNTGESWFFWCLKGANISHYSGEPDGWEWPPRLSGRVAATDKNDARKKLAAEFGEEFPMRVLKKDQVKYPFLLYIEKISVDDSSARYIRRFMPQQCQVCETPFTQNELYNASPAVPQGGQHTCSRSCEHVFQSQLRSERTVSGLSDHGVHQAMIYCITHKPSGKKYIGKTNQAFTLRWYQHMYQPGSTEFHQTIKNSSVTDWLFEVVECTKDTIPIGLRHSSETYRNAVAAREQYWINHFDTLNNGFNTAVSHKETASTPQQSLLPA